MKQTYRFAILNKYFFSQPHQPFFVFGIFWSLLFIFVFALSHNGIVSLLMPENLFHSYSLIFIIFSQFFYGFLFTTFPRFCSSVTIPKTGYVRMTLLYQIGAIIFLMGSLISWKLALLGMIFIFLANALAVLALYLVYINGFSPAKQDPFWLLIAQYIGVGSNLAMLVWYFFYNIDIIFDPTPINLIAFYLYLVFTAFVIGQRMIPFFSHSMDNKPKYFIHSVFGLLVVKIIFSTFNLLIYEIIVNIALGLYLLKEIISWKLNTSKSPAILWILHLAFYWMPLALFIGTISNIYKYFYHIDMLFLEIHLLALGFLTTVLIGFGTRVSLGHSGRTPTADKTTVYIFWLTQMVALIRFLLSVSTPIFQNVHIMLFNATVALWLFMFVVWSKKYIKILILNKE